MTTETLAIGIVFLVMVTLQLMYREKGTKPMNNGKNTQQQEPKQTKSIIRKILAPENSVWAAVIDHPKWDSVWEVLSEEPKDDARKSIQKKGQNQ